MAVIPLYNTSVKVISIVPISLELMYLPKDRRFRGITQISISQPISNQCLVSTGIKTGSSDRETIH